MTENSFKFHLTELRTRSIRIIFAFFLGFAISWIFKDYLWDLFKQPVLDYLEVTQGALIFISPVEKFFTYLKFCGFSAFILTSPYIFYQIWSFFNPGLYQKEKVFFVLFSFASWLLFFLSLTLCYFIVSPLVFSFLIQFGDPTDLAFLSMKEYLSFFIQLILVFCLVFQLPLLMSFLAYIGFISSQFLKKYRGYFLIGLSVISMLFTPPDVVSMLLLLIPLYLLYELSIYIIVYFIEKKKK